MPGGGGTGLCGLGTEIFDALPSPKETRINHTRMEISDTLMFVLHYRVVWYTTDVSEKHTSFIFLPEY
jgi:hypothetical protein